MTPYHLLIPLDGSSFSHHVLYHIRRFFDPQQYRVTLLRVAEPQETVHVSPPRVSGAYHWIGSSYDTVYSAQSTHPVYVDQLEHNLEATLQQELRPALQLLESDGFIVSTIVRFGDPAEEIIRVVATTSADLVAMATHGRTGLPRLVMGSVAEHVLHSLSIPVMLIRPVNQPTAVLEAADERSGALVAH
jgi:nucleotide-binding universal stress UspA family protein